LNIPGGKNFHSFCEPLFAISLKSSPKPIGIEKQISRAASIIQELLHRLLPSFVFKNFWFISKLVDQIFDESLPRARKERQIAPQASAGYPLCLNSLLAIRKAQRGRD